VTEMRLHLGQAVAMHTGVGTRFARCTPLITASLADMSSAGATFGLQQDQGVYEGFGNLISKAGSFQLPSLPTIPDVSNEDVFGLQDQVYEELGDLVAKVGSLQLPSLPSIPTAVDDFNVLSGELLDLLSAVTLQLQIAGTSVLAVSALLALLSGFIFGDRSSPSAVFREVQDASTFRTELSEASSQAWDRGQTDLVAIGLSKNSRFARAQEVDEAAARSSIFGKASRGLARPVSVGLWLELVFCVLIDAAGNASLFVPGYGELTDLVGASVTSFLVTLIFDWPALAAVAYWEEVLPLTDILPTCTLGWTVLILGLRPWVRARRGMAPREEKTKPPVADLQSYGPLEDYMRPGSKPWE